MYFMANGKESSASTLHSSSYTRRLCECDHMTGGFQRLSHRDQRMEVANGSTGGKQNVHAFCVLQPRFTSSRPNSCRCSAVTRGEVSSAIARVGRQSSASDRSCG